MKLRDTDRKIDQCGLILPFHSNQDAEAGRREESELLDWVLSFGFCLAPLCLMMFFEERMRHWFVMPLLACGLLTGVDLTRWIRGKVNLMDPAGMIGIIGFHFFYLSSLLFVYLDIEMTYVVEYPPDWREWFGWMAVLNFLGLGIYWIARDFSLKMLLKYKTFRRKMQIVPGRLYIGCSIILVVSSSLQLWIYSKFGGVSGYIETFETSMGEFRGMGWLFTIAEIFPIVALLGYVVAIREFKVKPSWQHIVFVLAAFFAMKLFFGGLRGSRSNSVFVLVWAVGIIHFWVRPLSRKFVLAGLPLLAAFMYIYGFYKAEGRRGLEALGDSTYRSHIELQQGRTFTALLLGDFSRCNVQAYLLYILSADRPDYEYGLGRTYLGSLALLIPESLWPTRPPTKVKEGTEALYGAGSFVPDGLGIGRFASSRIYGLAGEAMLNFTWIAVPLSFIVLGAAVAWVRFRIRTLAPGDPRLLTVGFWSLACCLLLTLDSDNMIFVIVKQMSLPFALLFFTSKSTSSQDAC